MIKALFLLLSFFSIANAKKPKNPPAPVAQTLLEYAANNKLTISDLQKNPPEDVPENTLTESLYGLDLRNLNLTSIEGIDTLKIGKKYIKDYANLIIYLENNQLTEIHPDIGNLTNVFALYLGGNLFSTLPQTMTKMSSLNVINIEKNTNIKTIPSVLFSLPQLTKLGVSYCSLTAIPPAITNLTELRDIHVAYNRITSLPDGFEALINLKILRAQGNAIKDLSNLGDAQFVYFIDITENPITFIAETPGFIAMANDPEGGGILADVDITKQPKTIQTLLKRGDNREMKDGEGDDDSAKINQSLLKKKKVNHNHKKQKRARTKV